MKYMSIWKGKEINTKFRKIHHMIKYEINFDIKHNKFNGLNMSYD